MLHQHKAWKYIRKFCKADRLSRSSEDAEHRTLYISMLEEIEIALSLKWALEKEMAKFPNFINKHKSELSSSVSWRYTDEGFRALATYFIKTLHETHNLTLAPRTKKQLQKISSL